MSAEADPLAELRDLLLRGAGTITARQLSFFCLWCARGLRPYMQDCRSVAALMFAEQSLFSATDSDERAQRARGARAALVDQSRWTNAATSAQELRRRRLNLHAAHLAWHALGSSLPNGGVLAASKLAAHSFAWANLDHADHLEDLGDELRKFHLRLQVRVFRDIVGDLEQPVEFADRWRTNDVVAIARGIEAEPGQGCYPILGDALDDAGCTDERILEHCRSTGPHVPGCWLIETILERG